MILQYVASIWVRERRTLLWIGVFLVALSVERVCADMMWSGRWEPVAWLWLWPWQYLCAWVTLILGLAGWIGVMGAHPERWSSTGSFWRGLRWCGRGLPFFVTARWLLLLWLWLPDVPPDWRGTEVDPNFGFEGDRNLRPFEYEGTLGLWLAWYVLWLGWLFYMVWGAPEISGRAGLMGRWVALVIVGGIVLPLFLFMGLFLIAAMVYV